MKRPILAAAFCFAAFGAQAGGEFNPATGVPGSGTVTSVTFTGDGVVDSSTPSSAVTGSGTLTATIKTQTANTVLAGPVSGGALAAAFRVLVPLDLGGSPASHGTLIDVAGTPTWKVVPDCADTGGSHLNYTQSSDAFSCGTSGGGSGTVNSGTTPQAAYYATSTTTVSGAPGVTYPNANSISVGTPTGTPSTGEVNVAAGFKVNNVPVGQVVAGTSQTVSAAQWAAGTTFVVTSASQTLTLPATSTLSTNGGIIIQTVGVSAALAPNGTDTINAVNATKTIGSGVSSVVTTNAAGAVYATPTAASVPAMTGWIATVNPNKAVLYTADRALRISSIVGRVSDATGGVATVQVNKAPSGTSCSGGTALHSGTLDANGTANTNQTLTLVGGATDDLAIGDSLCLVTTGTTGWTSGVGIGGVTVSMAPL